MALTLKAWGYKKRFLAAYRAQGADTEGNILLSALAAGYSPRKAKEKRHAFRRWIFQAEREQRLKKDPNPANTRSLTSGKLLPVSFVLAEQANNGGAQEIHPTSADQPTARPNLNRLEFSNGEASGVDLSSGLTLFLGPEPVLDSWAKDELDGKHERLYFDCNGELTRWIDEELFARKIEYTLGGAEREVICRPQAEQVQRGYYGGGRVGFAAL